MAVIKRATGIRFTYGGDEHRGWLPSGAAKPLPTPIRHVTLDISIEDTEGAGCLLIFVAREDAAFGNDYWFESLTAAEAAAQIWFGIEPGQWQKT